MPPIDSNVVCSVNSSDTTRGNRKSKSMVKFSGFYEPERDISSEHYGAAWLATRETFTNEKYISGLKTVENTETVSFDIMEGRKVSR